VSGLLITAIALGTVAVVELPDNSGLASLVLGTRYRPLGVFAGTAAAFAVHAALAVTAGSLLALAPHKIVQIVVAAVFLAGAVLVLRADNDDDDEDEARLKADATGFWPVAATSFGVILLAELGDPSDITMANLAARYHDPVAVGIGSVLALWSRGRAGQRWRAAAAADPAAAVDRPPGRAGDGRHGRVHPGRSAAVGGGLQPACRHRASEAEQQDSGHDLAGHQA